MLLLLPPEEDGIGVLEKSLTEDAVATWIAHLRGREVQVFLPRFEIACPLGLNRALTAMGLVNAFGDADFSGMDGSQALHLDAVLHKAFVQVDEQGTEAASATAVIKRGAARSEQLAVFRVDHPFLFVIRERTTGSILFLGRVIDPSSGSD